MISKVSSIIILERYESIHLCTLRLHKSHSQWPKVLWPITIIRREITSLSLSQPKTLWIRYQNPKTISVSTTL